jgi:hypothetical protein
VPPTPPVGDDDDDGGSNKNGKRVAGTNGAAESVFRDIGHRRLRYRGIGGAKK